ncbi:GumC family protein [Mucilaginibacter sp. FT3.2]|uniref:GumC family protein n=1 Tax=Mucilaginibacter sp. FT3.2 TaxID=2723090 RepID=UPI0016229CE2|nr:polysaccharide biosynthesis tyrosine autokinase [Mucilaginibacter sp. FT3.2]MBB6232521.1 capsular exopolysaccharide synthesis family protein [Mucilaginibacter sp. FT3.2]
MNNTDILAEKLDFTYKKEVGQGDLMGLIAISLNYWYLFLISLIACLIFAFCYIQYLPTQWNVSGKIIVEDDKNSTSKSLTNGVNADLASLFDIKSNADNEVKILKSRGLLKQVVSKLNLNVHLYEVNLISKHELHNAAPFTITTAYKTSPQKVAKYSVQILNNNNFRLINEKEDLDVTGNFGTPIQLKDYTLTLNPTARFKPTGNYLIKIQPVKTAESELAGNFNVGLDDKQATVINLQLSAEDPAMGELVLQTLMKAYLQNNLSNKIRIADSTMKFIDTRLVVVGAELNKVEKSLEQYKVQNKISDINAQSKALVEGANQYQDKLNENEVQLAIANDLYKYVNKENGNQVVPSSLITKDMAFGTAINSYNEMLLKKEEMKLTLTDNSSYIQNLDQQISLARKALLTSLGNYRNSLQVSQSAFRKQNSSIENKISGAPVKERIYLDYARQQSLKQDLYLFLLQKREETAISQTATISSCRILDDAESDEAPFAPKKSLIYTLSLFAGIFIPAAGLSLKEMLNVRINSKSDIDKHTSVPLLGEISRNLNKKKNLIYNDTRSVISEEIRALRTNLKYVTEKGKSNVILFTSSMSGEGKSFISLNLGNSIALSGKKVVLLELDLRKPRLLKNIGVENDYGFTNYVISGEEGDIEELIKPSTFNENFYFISSGPIPPNPAEILMSDHLKTLIDDLKTRFDYVIIDSAPVGLVSDALIIEEFADITCYVLRQNYTYKSQLGIVNDLYKTKKAKRLYLIVNDIEIQKNSITGYGHGYGSYGYNAIDEESESAVAHLMKKIKPVLNNAKS